MELMKTEWTQDDIKEFENYLISLAKPDKSEWSKNIVRTNKPVLAIKSPALRNIAKEIFKGNYLDFLNLEIFSTQDSTVIYAIIISKIKNYNTFLQYFKVFLNNIDSWSHTDAVSLVNLTNNLPELIELSQKLLTSKKPYERRMSLIILLKLINHLTDYTVIFYSLNALEHEEHYYVNMAGAWLLCEAFVKGREQVITYYQNNSTNKFIINKSIQKCRDSFRVTPQDKELLLQFKKQ